jgi:RimJ/RimL family protein N-acetyltransferase
MASSANMTIDSEEPFASRSRGQAFFVGPTLFLRPVELDDAASAPVWHPDPWPKPAELIREQFQDQLGDDPDAEADRQRMLICRRADDRPLGSVFFEYEHDRACTLWFTHDPNRSLDERAAIEAEVMSFTLPFLLEKRNLMMVYTDHVGEHPLVTETAARLGMRQNYRLREAYFVRGARYDRIGYELLDPRWVATLGMPRGMQEGPVDRVVRAPAPLQWHPPTDLPANVIIAGERLSLRPFDPADGALASRWLMQDTDDSFPNGPDVVNPWVYGQRFVALAKETPPTWPRFAIVRNEDGLLIGANGIENLDLLHRTAETESTIFHPDFRGQGYGTEAKHLLLDYAFDRLGLHMVYSWVSEFNTRSAAALRKQGYREAGYFAWAHPYQGNFTGGWYFDYLAEEWRAARR